MIETQQQFWNDWAEAYRGFSETIEPYREAQQLLARSTIVALGDGAQCTALTFLDAGGGAGNMISPVLEALCDRRGSLDGVTYVLTDGADTMVRLAQGRLDSLRKSYPGVAFRVVHADTLGADFVESVGPGTADVALSSWNIEYYPPKKRQEIVTTLTRLVSKQGVVAFSSTVQLPEDLTLRDVLMPLGKAQVFHALLTRGPRRMQRVITGLNQIAQFGDAAGDGQFPEKPTLAELKELARQAGLSSIMTEYHLYGASVMVIGRSDATALPELPKSPIAQAFAGKAGYTGYPDTITFWRYLQALRRGRQ